MQDPFLLMTERSAQPVKDHKVSGAVGKKQGKSLEFPLVVCIALQVRNKAIGYCQSMNFIVATLLLYCSEEESFWTLCSLIEDVLPEGYYTETLSGLRAASRWQLRSCRRAVTGANPFAPRTCIYSIGVSNNMCRNWRNTSRRILAQQSWQSMVKATA